MKRVFFLNNETKYKKVKTSSQSLKKNKEGAIVMNLSIDTRKERTRFPSRFLSRAASVYLQNTRHGTRKKKKNSFCFFLFLLMVVVPSINRVCSPFLRSFHYEHCLIQAFHSFP
jgi:hypothetical protein